MKLSVGLVLIIYIILPNCQSFSLNHLTKRSYNDAKILLLPADVAGKSDTDFGIKQKRCYNINVGAALATRELHSTINEKLCETCRNNPQCRVHGNCLSCERWCGGGGVAENSQMPAGENPPPPLESRFADDDNERKIFTLGKLKTRNEIRLICKMLGVKEDREIDEIIVIAKTHSNSLPAFYSNIKGLTSDEASQLTSTLNEQLDEKMRGKTVDNVLSNGEINEALDSALAKIRKGNNGSLENRLGAIADPESTDRTILASNPVTEQPSVIEIKEEEYSEPNHWLDRSKPAEKLKNILGAFQDGRKRNHLGEENVDKLGAVGEDLPTEEEKNIAEATQDVEEAKENEDNLGAAEENAAPEELMVEATNNGQTLNQNEDNLEAVEEVLPQEESQNIVGATNDVENPTQNEDKIEEVGLPQIPDLNKEENISSLSQVKDQPALDESAKIIEETNPNDSLVGSTREAEVSDEEENLTNNDAKLEAIAEEIQNIADDIKIPEDDKVAEPSLFPDLIDNNNEDALVQDANSQAEKVGGIEEDVFDLTENVGGIENGASDIGEHQSIQEKTEEEPIDLLQNKEENRPVENSGIIVEPTQFIFSEEPKADDIDNEPRVNVGSNNNNLQNTEAETEEINPNNLGASLESSTQNILNIEESSSQDKLGSNLDLTTQTNLESRLASDQIIVEPNNLYSEPTANEDQNTPKILGSAFDSTTQNIAPNLQDQINTSDRTNLDSRVGAPNIDPAVPNPTVGDSQPENQEESVMDVAKNIMNIVDSQIKTSQDNVKSFIDKNKLKQPRFGVLKAPRKLNLEPPRRAVVPRQHLAALRPTRVPRVYNIPTRRPYESRLGSIKERLQALQDARNRKVLPKYLQPQLKTRGQEPSAPNPEAPKPEAEQNNELRSANNEEVVDNGEVQDILGSSRKEDSGQNEEIVEDKIVKDDSLKNVEEIGIDSNLGAPLQNPDPENVEARGSFNEETVKMNEEISDNFGKIVPAEANSLNGNSMQPAKAYFIGNGIKLPLHLHHNLDGTVDLTVDIEKLCSCKNSTCPKNHNIEETVGTILEKEAELKNELSSLDETKQEHEVSKRSVGNFTTIKNTIKNNAVGDASNEQDDAKTAIKDQYKFKDIKSNLENKLEILNNNLESYKDDNENILNESAMYIFHTKNEENEHVKKQVDLVNTVLAWMKDLAIDHTNP